MKINIRDEFPYDVERTDHLWIELSDGVRLAARLWLPGGAEHDPVPAILEYLPYRLTDGTAGRDALMHPYFAGHGYASIRVDMRGSGNADGILMDEYLQQEQDDALEVLAWIAQQPWCNGRVGMIGISWGGFNGLQIAARRPEQLNAVITLCSTDDRYADDVHYIGGCLNAADQLSWASTMLLYNAKPPLPWVAGDSWRESWLNRIDETPPWIEAWMAHQRRDDFWKHGSICEEYDQITCPVFVVGGWSDGYTNAVPRMLEHLSCPRKGLIGPWAHAYPEFALPGPRIGFLQECLRWWDRWLKQIDTGVDDDPDLRVWMTERLEPAGWYESLPGSWRSCKAWPPAGRVKAAFHLNANGSLAGDAAEAEPMLLPGSLLHGKDAGAWCPYGVAGDFPIDQRQEDGLSLTFDTEPLNDPLEILGNPSLQVSVTSDKPQAMLVARMCDVWPDGRSTLISRGVLNLSHRESHEYPTSLVPGQTYRLSIDLNATGYVLAAGHRLRLALSSAYWPWAWPSPEVASVWIESGDSATLTLPSTGLDAGREGVAFAAAETASPPVVETLIEPRRTSEISFDPTSQTQVVVLADHKAERHVDLDLRVETTSQTTWSIVEGDPLSASNTVENSWAAARGDWNVRILTRSTLTADRSNFHLTTQVEAFEGNIRVRAKSRSARIPRDHA